MEAKDAFSSVDIQAVARAIQSLGKCWLDKAYDVEGGSFLFTFRVPERDKVRLLVEPGRFLALTTGEVAHRPEPGSFSQNVRKWLSGLPLVGIEQPGGERYLELAFQRSMEEKPRLLVIELFGDGNLLVVREGTIVAILTQRKWAHRTLRPGEAYMRPPSRRDPFALTRTEIATALSQSKTSLVTTLAARLSLGGPLAEEVVARAGLDPASPASLEPDRTAEKILGSWKGVLAEVGTDPKGYLYSENGTLIDVQPFAAARWRDRPGVACTEVPTFSEAARQYFAAHPKIAQVKPPEEIERERLERLRTQQMEGITLLEGMAKELRDAADAILTNYSEVEARVKTLLDRIPDSEEAEIEVKGKKVRLNARKPPRAAATELYEEAKRQAPKLEGAKRALEQTESALATLGKRKVATSRRKAAEAAVHRTRNFWFEKAPRWFITSKGIPVVAGRDAKSNDGVVKRYLKETDFYIHADVHGAPSVVVKVPQGKEVTPESLEEAGAWAVSFSKAWRAGHASADAFWVRGDQVSKAGGSGEYVPVGSWVIHGSKHVMRDLPISLVIGEVTFEGERLLVSAPPKALATPDGRTLYRISPGDERRRAAVEKELARGLGVSLTTVQSLLPGGGVQAERA